MKTKEKVYGVVVMLLVVVAVLFASYLDNTYPMKATVQRYNGEMCFVDIKGEAWSDDRVEEFKEGDEVEITFNMMGTEHNRYDDEIVRVKRLDK